MSAQPRIAVIGLGYVGLPLAVEMARHFPVVGFDVDGARVGEIRAGRDRTREVRAEALGASTLTVSDDPAHVKGADIYVVAAPTPVDGDNRPDLSALRAACRTIGGVMAEGAVVVFESTVYPGVTEDVCGPELERVSGLVCGRDFFLGYSPERINPGDREHTVDRITKVVAGQTPAVAATLEEVYGALTAGDVFVAKDIRTAEAAKVIENAQRDINIAFINEVAMIFERLGLSVHDVLEASATKWNFLDFRPGLVGGHCIGVDPFYLAHCASELGHHPEIILAGRRINDSMGAYLAGRIQAALGAADDAAPKTLVLGLTFKENVPDLRNSKVVDLIAGLGAYGHAVDVHDPLAAPDEARRLYGIDLVADIAAARDYDCLVCAVAHADYAALGGDSIAAIVRPGGLVADIKGTWRHLDMPAGVRRWEL